MFFAILGVAFGTRAFVTMGNGFGFESMFFFALSILFFTPVALRLRDPGGDRERSGGTSDISTDWRVRVGIASDPSTPGDVLSRLASDPMTEVRLAVAINESTPEWAVEKLREDRNRSVRRQASGHGKSI